MSWLGDAVVGNDSEVLARTRVCFCRTIICALESLGPRPRIVHGEDEPLHNVHSWLRLRRPFVASSSMRCRYPFSSAGVLMHTHRMYVTRPPAPWEAVKDGAGELTRGARHNPPIRWRHGTEHAQLHTSLSVYT
jgi:hypothetical protein